MLIIFHVYDIISIVLTIFSSWKGENALQSFIALIEPASRYIFLGVSLYVVLRMLLAMFFKKTSYPVRGKLINNINGDAIPLYENEISVGRNKKCDVMLGYDTISRFHAVLAFRKDGLTVFDTNSKLGVSVNGEKINNKMALSDGDVVGFGGLEYTLEIAPYKYIKDRSRLIARPFYPFSLLLLTVFDLVALMLDSYPDGKFSASIAAAFGLYILLQWSYYIFATYVLRFNHFELECIAFLLTGLGLSIAASIYPKQALKQFAAIAIGVVLYCVLLILQRDLEMVKFLRWAAAAGAIGLLGLTLLIAKPNNGALNWINLGGFSLQPSELAKVAFIFVGAVTLEKLQSVRHLTLYMLFAAVCVGELFLMYDFGAALIFFFTFIVIAFMRSGDIRTLMLICIAAALGAGLIIVFKPYVASRFSTYTHVWDYMDAGGYQQTRTLIYSASGGLFGLGLGAGKLRDVFASAEDLVFGVVCEEFGCIMGFLVPITLALITMITSLHAQKTKSTFYAIGSVAASAMMLFQAMLSVFGITDLLPLTGVTLPFVSKGGSSIICCFCLLSLIKAADLRTYASFKPQLERRPAQQ